MNNKIIGEKINCVKKKKNENKGNYYTQIKSKSILLENKTERKIKSNEEQMIYELSYKKTLKTTPDLLILSCQDLKQSGRGETTPQPQLKGKTINDNRCLSSPTKWYTNGKQIWKSARSLMIQTKELFAILMMDETQWIKLDVFNDTYI